MFTSVTDKLFDHKESVPTVPKVLKSGTVLVSSEYPDIALQAMLSRKDEAAITISVILEDCAGNLLLARRKKRNPFSADYSVSATGELFIETGISKDAALAAAKSITSRSLGLTPSLKLKGLVGGDWSPMLCAAFYGKVSEQFTQLADMLYMACENTGSSTLFYAVPKIKLLSSLRDVDLPEEIKFQLKHTFMEDDNSYTKYVVNGFHIEDYYLGWCS